MKNEIIDDILHRLGGSGQPHEVAMSWRVFQPHAGSARGIIHGWGTPASTLAGDHIPDIRHTADPVLHVGERLVLRIRSKKAGRLHLFNLGTSGNVSVLFPYRGWNVDNEIQADFDYEAPGNLIPASFFPDGAWVENGPISDENDLPERLLAVVTDPAVRLNPMDLHESLGRLTTRGGIAAVEETVGRLFMLPGGSWSFGLLEIWVER